MCEFLIYPHGKNAVTRGDTRVSFVVWQWHPSNHCFPLCLPLCCSAFFLFLAGRSSGLRSAPGVRQTGYNPARLHVREEPHTHLRNNKNPLEENLQRRFSCFPSYLCATHREEKGCQIWILANTNQPKSRPQLSLPAPRCYSSSAFISSIHHDRAFINLQLQKSHFRSPAVAYPA